MNVNEHQLRAIIAKGEGLDIELKACRDQLPKMMLYGKRYGGADPQFIEGDNFRMIISVPEFGENPARSAKIIPADKVTPQVTPQVDHLLKVIQGEMSRVQIMKILELKDREHFREHYLQRAIKAGLLEPTMPEKPNSRLQKYRLTPKGRKRLDENR